MKFERHHIESQKNNYVQGIWSLESSQNKIEIDLIPDGFPEVVIPIRGNMSIQVDGTQNQIKNPSVIGLINTVGKVSMEAHSQFIFVKLMPWALPILTRNSAILFKNNIFEIEEFNGKMNREIKACMYHSLDQSISEILKVISRYSESPFYLPSILKCHISSLFHQTQSCQFSPLTADLKCSLRYLEIQYKKFVGISPKKFERLLKVKKASLLISNNPGEKLIHIAQLMGYYDQSHFYKDFKAIVNQKPSEFRKSLDQQIILSNSSYKSQYQYS